VQLRDSLENIYDLVFELRKEVEDLHFQVHSTNNKVATLLHFLASMSTTTKEGDTMQQSAENAGMECTSTEMEKVDSASRQQQLEAQEAEHAVDSVNTEMIWDSRPTYIEEESWLGDLSATNQGHQSGV
jgi:hypothetical protein